MYAFQSLTMTIMSRPGIDGGLNTSLQAPAWTFRAYLGATLETWPSLQLSPSMIGPHPNSLLYSRIQWTYVTTAPSLLLGGPVLILLPRAIGMTGLQLRGRTISFRSTYCKTCMVIRLTMSNRNKSPPINNLCLAGTI